ncbi:hypothetical protein [Parasphingorhabdus cellanae]|uniref:Uncharacterized protein n=1 Tax=Parasphingorhabdus cellanae TaxID=2806553 RepID=A0ABX7T352_9SPHN|nr:hypothetical protein [Parasphingorhabdus cellanae]QTD55586.1 hypothetical protein J4G78_15500 [Parasphingorhabdus cellanae]
MKYALITLVAASVFPGLSAVGQAEQMQYVTEPFVMPQSRAQHIVSKLGDMTLKSGDRPSVAQLARDCLSATSYIMKDGAGVGGINQSAMPGMSFWGSINGAVYVRADRNGRPVEFGEGDTVYQRKFLNDEDDAAIEAGQVPGFVRDHYTECESIRKRFGG